MSHDDLDNYNVDFDDDPFASPPPDAPASKKRKEPDSGLGIDQEVSIQKRPRVPNVKLDDERLLGPMGIPKLKSRAAGLQLKGKGHEFSDAARLLSFYQLWLDDLFPKARFLDALAMVEKAGHKKALQIARQEWISQGQPKDTGEVEAEDLEGGQGGEEAARNGDAATVPDTVTSPHQQPSQPTTQKQSTPVRTDVLDDEDLYDVTPRITRVAAPRDDGVPDNDDLEALMAETELLDTTLPVSISNQSRRHNEGDPAAAAEEEEEDLDALIAEAEAQERAQPRSNQAGNIALEDNNYADDEEAMREMEGW